LAVVLIIIIVVLLTLWFSWNIYLLCIKQK